LKGKAVTGQGLDLDREEQERTQQRAARGNPDNIVDVDGGWAAEQRLQQVMPR